MKSVEKCLKKSGRFDTDRKGGSCSEIKKICNELDGLVDDNLYNAVGIILACETDDDLTIALRDIRKGRLGLDAKSYDKVRTQVEKMKPVEIKIEECGRRCPNPQCKSLRTYPNFDQARSVDEGMTISYRCGNCGRRFITG